MALSNYTQLQAAVATWYKRDSALIPDFITLAESRINAELDSRLSYVESSLVGVVGSRYIALPTGYYSNQALWLTTYGTRTEIIFVTPDQLPVSIDTQGQPTYYTIEGSNIAFEYENNVAHTYTFRYKKAFDIASTSTNHVLTNYPNLYLFGALVEAHSYAKDIEEAQGYEMRYQQALIRAQIQEDKNLSRATMASDPGLIGTPRSNIFAGDM